MKTMALHHRHDHPYSTPKEAEKAAERKHTARNIGAAILGAVIVLLVVARLYAPIWVTDYVNKSINNIPGYSGSISDVDLHLYRGAYVIHDLKLFKTNAGIPVPFLSFDKSDLSLQWGALLHGRIVGDVTLTHPVINFATGKSGATQTGAHVDWTKPIKALMPLDINWVEIKDGTITYQDFDAREKVDLSIYDVNAKATNLRNVEDVSNALPSTLTLRGTSVGKGKLALDGRMNILREIPDFDMKGKLEQVNLPALNDYARHFAGIDFTTGTLNIYSDMTVKNGHVSGFVKPLATHISLLDPKDPNQTPISVIWESIVSAVMEIFQNQPKDQFATQIRLEGDLNNPKTDFWSTVGGILHNAFVKAYTHTIKQE